MGEWQLWFTLFLAGGSSSADINGIESLKVRSKCEEKLSSNTSSPVDNDFELDNDFEWFWPQWWNG